MSNSTPAFQINTGRSRVPLQIRWLEAAFQMAFVGHYDWQLHHNTRHEDLTVWTAPSPPNRDYDHDARTLL